MKMYERDQEATTKVQAELQAAIDKTREELLAAHEQHNLRIRAFEDLRQRAGGMVLVLGFFIAALSVPISMFWNAIFVWLTRT